MKKTSNAFIPQHLNVTAKDLAGNHGIGRYILMPGSDGRAREIAGHLKHQLVKTHPRGHHCYLGAIDSDAGQIEVAVVSTGMGCPSVEIILHELFNLGAKRFLRVGTAGSLQPDFVKYGDIVNALASVRDERTTVDYVPLSVPAVASYEYVTAIMQAAERIGLKERLHTGTVHCKSSLYAREFGAGPKAEINEAYMNLLSHCGVLATEMETSALFILSQIYNYQLMQQGKGADHHVLVGAILGIIAFPHQKSISAKEKVDVENKLIELAIESVKVLWASEK